MASRSSHLRSRDQATLLCHGKSVVDQTDDWEAYTSPRYHLRTSQCNDLAPEAPAGVGAGICAWPSLQCCRSSQSSAVEACHFLSRGSAGRASLIPSTAPGTLLVWGGHAEALTQRDGTTAVLLHVGSGRGYCFPGTIESSICQPPQVPLVLEGHVPWLGRWLLKGHLVQRRASPPARAA